MKLLLSPLCACAFLALAAPAFATTPTPTTPTTPTTPKTPTTSTSVEAAPAPALSQSQNQTQSQQQQQSQSQDQSTANANNAQQSVDARQYAPRNVASALAPAVINVAPCAIGAGAGVQSPTFGLSLGGSKIDRACERRANAMILMQLNETEAAVIYLAAGDRDMADAIRIARTRPVAIAAAPVWIAPPAPLLPPAPVVAAAPVVVVQPAVAAPRVVARRTVRPRPVRVAKATHRARPVRLAAIPAADCAPGPNRLAQR